MGNVKSSQTHWIVTVSKVILFCDSLRYRDGADRHMEPHSGGPRRHMEPHSAPAYGAPPPPPSNPPPQEEAAEYCDRMLIIAVSATLVSR